MRKKITAFIMVLVMIVCAGVLPDGVAYAEDIFNSGSIKMVSAGNDYTAIVKEDGSLWMVGRNNSGQFGNGTKNSSTTPVKIMDDVKAVSAGSDYTAIIKNDGSLWMVGINNYGQLGDGTTISRSTPVFVTTNVKSVSTIGNLHTAILKEDNSLWMVGRNDYGQLGDGTSTNKTTPQMVMDRVFFAGAGDRYTAILKEDKSLWMVGLNDYGQLGDGTTENREMPVSIMTEVDSISTRRLHSAIIKDDGSLWMVGLNEYGQLGNGTTTNSNVPINTMTNVRFVSAGYNHTAVIKEDGSLWMMGENIYGQLGDGTTISKNIPVGIMVGVKSVSAGYRHSAILKEDGSLWMVGQNDYGQLGDGTTINKSTPIKIFDGNGENNESFFDGFQDKKIEACKQIESAHYTGNMGDSFIDNLVQEKRQDSNARRWAVGQNDYTNKDWDEGSVISIARWSGGSEISWAYEVMDIGGLYKYFSAKILKGYSTNSENYSMNLSFIDYETDTVLETYEINQNTLEFDVYVNVEGVRYLKILVKDNKPAGRRCTYLMLDGILSNNKKEFGDGDSDGDGIPDAWEKGPVDLDGDGVDDINLKSMGAEVGKKDIFVEVDFMDGAIPSKDTLIKAYKIVTEQFRDHGYYLHIDAGEYSYENNWKNQSKSGVIPFVDTFVLSNFYNSNPDSIKWYDNWSMIESKIFDKERRPIFHHCMFVNKYKINLLDKKDSSTGISMGVPGQSFICATMKNQDEIAVAGTFMHELGHNLGLMHGGDENTNYKPNYLSIMNYAFQVTGLVWQDSFIKDDKIMINYSEYILPAIDEKVINEYRGIDPMGSLPQGLSTKIYGISQKQYSLAFDDKGNHLYNLSKQPIDFNRSKSYEVIKQDINGDGKLTLLGASINDWNNLVLKAGAIGDAGASLDTYEFVFDASKAITEDSYEEILAGPITDTNENGDGNTGTGNNNSNYPNIGGNASTSYPSGTASSGTSLTRPPVTTQNGGTTTNNNQKDKDADKDGGVKYFTLYRLYNAKSGEHLYTIDTIESAELVRLGWQQETTPGEALSKGVPIYRLYNPASGGHLYTPDENECKVLTSEFGWVYDNNKKPVFYGKVGDGTSVFRLYNPGIKSLAANHHYTSDKIEIEHLIRNGSWVYDNDKAPVFILK